MASSKYAVIVVGGGVLGLTTAYHLAKQGVKKVLVLEQFPIPHSRGTSHGHSRVIRYAFEDTYYSRMAVDAFRMWHQIERETNMRVIIKTEFVALANSDSGKLAAMDEFLAKIGVPYDRLKAAEIQTKLPQLSHIEGKEAILDRLGGIMPADKVIRLLLRLIVDLGGEIHEREGVTSIEPRNLHTANVTTSRACYQAKSVVITVGAWSSQVVKPLGLKLNIKTLTTTVGFWREKPNERQKHTVDLLPPIVDYSEKHAIHIMPIFEYPGQVKIYAQVQNLKDANVEEDETAVVGRYVKKHLHGLEWSSPCVVEEYTSANTSDGHFIIDAHPKWRNIIFGVSMNSHGFSLSIVVGKILADLSMGSTPSYDISPFAMDRFHFADVLPEPHFQRTRFGSHGSLERPHSRADSRHSRSYFDKINSLFKF